MHRFRKKPETRRQHNPELVEGVHTSTEVQDDAVPTLPPASDFRTSLILPGLTRRFTLLRSYNGDPVAIEDLKSRFAEQRRRGAPNQVSEVEENMILEALGRMRFTGSSSRDDANTTENSPRASTSHSVDTDTASSTSKPSKRFSNNLFGSARLRDYNYVRSVERGGSSRSAVSFSPSEVSTSTRNGDQNGFLRPRTPEEGLSSFNISAPSSPEQYGAANPTARVSKRESGEANLSTSDFRLSSTFSQDAFKRASMALEDVIREIEEEAEVPGVDDDIVLLRSPTAAGHNESSEAEPDSLDESETQYALTGTALSSDEQVQVEEFKRTSTTSPAPGMYSSSRTTSPTPRLPGYIPGMQRPMTPRDAGLESDHDDQSTSATTPRARSPRLPGMSTSIVVPASSRLGRRDSNASTAKQPSRTSTPMSAPSPPPFFSRTVNGRFTPEDRQGAGDLGESALDRQGSRRRPVSPLTSQAFQPMVSSSSSSSRAGTPSSPGWQHHGHNSSTTSSRMAHGRNESGHSRNGSVNSLTDITSSDMHTYAAMDASFQRTKSSDTTRSPALPDSPNIDDSGRSSYNSFAAQQQSLIDRLPPNNIGMDLGSPFSVSRALRSPTPNDQGGYLMHGNGKASSRAKSPTQSPEKQVNGNSKARHLNNGSSSSVSGFTLSLGSSSSQPLTLSPFVNSSRSSLESEGSSYHSWDEEAGRSKDRLRALFAKVEAEPPEWHAISTPDDGYGTFGREEEVVRQLSGLTKADFASIQDRLIDVMTSKASDGARERVDRAPSALRKRRPSTSQSNYSVGANASRVASPVPIVTTRSASPSAATALATPPVTITTEQPQSNGHSSKANALLDSVIDAIQSPTKTANPIMIPPQPPATTPGSTRTRTASEVSSPTRRNRTLADLVFGPEDRVEEPLPTIQLPTITPLSVARAISTERSAHDNMSTPHLPQTPASPPVPSGRLAMGQISSPNLSYYDQSELTLEVQRKVDAATIALRKSPSNSKFPDVGPVARKKINRDQISSPTLVSATTSVDTIPLPSPSLNSTSSSKFGLRMKKFRGTLRSKPNGLPNGDEITPFPMDVHSSPQASPPLSQTATYPRAMEVNTGPASASEMERFKVNVTTPPATAGPGLKGFMARFRKSKSPDAMLDVNQPSASSRRGDIPHSSGSSLSMSISSSPQSQVQSVPAPKGSFTSRRSVSMRSAKRPQPPMQKQKLTQSMLMPNTAVELPQEEEDYTNDNDATFKDEAALKQLFDAASNLGLDQAALNSLVARSASTSSRSTTGWMSSRPSSGPSRKSRPPDISEDAAESSRAPSVAEGRSSLEGLSQRIAGPVIRKLSIKKHAEAVRRQQQPASRERTETPPPTLAPPSLPPPQPRPQDDKTPSGSRNTILRRTIIMPSETKGVPIDMNALLRKNSTATTTTRKRRSASAASIHSNRSIQDRAPTPPPPKSGAGKRFSTDAASPPVPNIPQSFSHLDVPTNVEKPNSMYDSLFDMYAGDSRVASAVSGDGQNDYDGLRPSESGPALEVIEMANGETIWSIVNGLRDDDAESFYGNRASFASEYSLKESNNEGVQVYFKDHGRSGSKGSVSSFLSRKKQQSAPANNRPETKVFFSSSAHIGRLIENLSKGLDSGSFNILPDNRSQSHATTPSMGSDSDVRWTVEERLEHMLGSMES